jgi:selenide,water dikinase
MAPGALAQVLSDLPNVMNPSLLIGYDTSDDAYVYKVNDDTALIGTVDFFPPMVDDPYTFGQIAAANALSDVYAMGGQPKIAMNILCWPNCLGVEMAGEVLRGGADKAVEAGCTIAGGHTIMDDEPKFGMCVTGFARPEEILSNAAARPKDLLIATKKIGSGILNTAVKGDLLDQKDAEELYRQMSTLNKYAAEVGHYFHIHACTDITGFGLAGHLCEMAEGANLTAELHYEDVPLMDCVVEFARMGIIPSGTYRNLDYFQDRVKIQDGLPQEAADVLFDPQSSGGLMFAVSPDEAQDFQDVLSAEGIDSAVVGEYTEKQDCFVRIV